MKTFEGTPEAPARDRLLVGVAEHVVASSGETLVAYGLGACVAVVLHDPDVGVGGLAHTMLPRRGERVEGPDGKFVDAAVPEMLREMIEEGAGYGSVRAWLVGGAELFELEDLTTGVADRNVAVAREELEAHSVPVVGEAVGGDAGRTVRFDTASGTVHVVTADGAERLLGGDDDD